MQCTMLRLRAAATTSLGLTLRGVAHIVASFVLSTVVYSAIYAAAVPEAELNYPLHFGLCDPPNVTRRVAAARLAPSDAGGRVAAAAPPLAPGYKYMARLCLELPESPPNVEVGTFLAELSLYSGEAAADGPPVTALDAVQAATPPAPPAMLFASARPFVLRYRSPQVRWLGNLFFMLPLVLGLLEEKQTHCAPLADELHNRRDRPALCAPWSHRGAFSEPVPTGGTIRCSRCAWRSPRARCRRASPRRVGRRAGRDEGGERAHGLGEGWPRGLAARAVAARAVAAEGCRPRGDDGRRPPSAGLQCDAPPPHLLWRGCGAHAHLVLHHRRGRSHAADAHVHAEPSPR